MRLSRLTKIGDYSVFIKVQLLKTLKIRTHGLEAIVKGTSFYVVFLDFDSIDEETLKEKLAALQELFEIGNFYVFETGYMSYHCVCIDALTPKEVYHIIGAAGCEQAFRNSMFINEHRTWVLRFDEKDNRPPPKYRYTMESRYEGLNPQSLGHSTYLKKFGIEIELKKPVGENRIGTEGYNTSDRHTAGYDESGLLELEEKLKGEMDRIESTIREYIKANVARERRRSTSEKHEKERGD